MSRSLKRAAGLIAVTVGLAGSVSAATVIQSFGTLYDNGDNAVEITLTGLDRNIVSDLTIRFAAAGDFR